MSYIAFERFNPDSYGYNHKDGTWTGFVLNEGLLSKNFELVTLEGEEAFVAAEAAKKNEVISEMAVATGAIAMVPVTVIDVNKKTHPQHARGDRVIIDEEDPTIEKEEDESLEGQNKKIKKNSKK